MRNYKPLILLIVLMFLIPITACQSSPQIAPTQTPAPTAAPTITSTPTQVPTATTAPTPTPYEHIDLNLELPEGDAERGFITAIKFHCYDCHGRDYAPDWGPRFTADEEVPFILERGAMRIALPEYEGQATTNWEYFIESIFVPGAYIVPGEWKNPMPIYSLERMTEQELADILAWINTLD